MTRELIIEGQHVDLAPDTDITLEYVGNILSGIGKIKMSHSYTVRLPRTLQNARILDDPGQPGHESGNTRRFLSARYYRNGIDILGDASAYILKASPEGYEIALLWGGLDKLSEWTSSGRKLTDIQGLPTLTWVDASGEPSYGLGTSAFFVRYRSGLNGRIFPQVNAATHPVVRFSALLDLIFRNAGVEYSIESAAAQAALDETVLLVAPNHKPSRDMEIYSGSRAYAAVIAANEYGLGYLVVGDWYHGWDQVTKEENGTYQVVVAEDNTKHRIILNLTGSSVLDGEGYIAVSAHTKHDPEFVMATAARYYFKTDEDGITRCVADDVLDLSGYEYYKFTFGFYDYNYTGQLGAYDPSMPLISVNPVHETIRVDTQNQFPVAENLPDMGQLEFIKGAMGLFGISPVIKDGKLLLYSYDDLLKTDGAVDWTDKVDMRNGGVADAVFTISGMAIRNTIIYEDDVELPFDPTAIITVDDTTLKPSAEFIKLPFAASTEDVAKHYEVTSEEIELPQTGAGSGDTKAEGEDAGTEGDTGTGEDTGTEGDTGTGEDTGSGEGEGGDSTPEDTTPEVILKTVFETKDIDIKPRIFGLTYGPDGWMLDFPNRLRGAELVKTYYSRYQELVKKPVTIMLNVRLNELDLVKLDLSRPVYIGQYGRYYAILKIQTSATDLCKVELLQLP